MQKGADRQIRSAPSIYSSCSTAASIKLDTPVSGGAYQDARKVSLVWNDSQKLGPHLNSEAGSTQTVTQRPFLPHLFRQDGKDGAAGGASEPASTERVPAVRGVSFPLSPFLPFQTAS